jgi:hypothetical protein
MTNEDRKLVDAIAEEVASDLRKALEFRPDAKPNTRLTEDHYLVEVIKQSLFSENDQRQKDALRAHNQRVESLEAQRLREKQEYQDRYNVMHDVVTDVTRRYLLPVMETYLNELREANKPKLSFWSKVTGFFRSRK